MTSYYLGSRRAYSIGGWLLRVPSEWRRAKAEEEEPAAGYLQAGRRRYIWGGSVRTRPCYLFAGDAWRRREARRGEARENMALHRGGGRNCCAEASGPLDGAAREEYNPRLHGACGLPGGGVRALLEATLIPSPRFRLSPAASSSSFLVSLTSTSLFYQRHDRSIVIVAVDPRRRRGG